ncbi:MAG: DUF2089 family protein [Acutalibacteraceae bacterium]|nr:DUF2089 family protein [Acutalibacteraceae bacterium]
MNPISKCPVCKNELHIEKLKCNHCGLELKNDFQISPFDALDEEYKSFLITFLKCKGNLKSLQEKLGISYPYAKKKLNDLLKALDLYEEFCDDYNEEHYENMKYDKTQYTKMTNTENWVTDINSNKASEIIKTKIKESGGKIVVQSYSGKQYEIFAAADGESFLSDALPIVPPIKYEVFDIVVDFLRENGGSARKGVGRNAKLGEPGCEKDTIVYILGSQYFGKKEGEYTFDPVFVLVAILEWAGIVHNKRGYINLTSFYRGVI